jgi:tRNA synthetase class I (I, L, M and V)
MDQESPPFRYGARLAGQIERRWQDRWEREGTFQAANASAAPKFYLLDFFPYPSGIGLHAGHPLGYIGTDVIGRYQRMTGHHVLHPAANGARPVSDLVAEFASGRRAAPGGRPWRELTAAEQRDAALVDPDVERYWMSPSGVDLYVGRGARGASSWADRARDGVVTGA